MAGGMSLATYNGRGVTWRGEGGQQERDLAATYQRYASALAYSHPFVSQMLQQIADFYERDAAHDQKHHRGDERRHLHAAPRAGEVAGFAIRRQLGWAD